MVRAASGAAQADRLRASSRRSHRPHRQIQPPERTQNWIKPAGNVTAYRWLKANRSGLRSGVPKRMDIPFFNSRTMACQRLPARLTGPPRFIGVPGRTPAPRAPTPGVATARATGRGRSTTPGLTTHPAGYPTYWQYTTALACSVLAATNPIVSSTDNAIGSFILASSSIRNPKMGPLGNLRLMQVKG